MWKVNRLLNWNLSLFLLAFLVVCNVYSQNRRSVNNTGTVTLLMPLVTEGQEDSLPGGYLDFEVFLISANGKRKLNFVSREPVGDRGNYIDKFESKVISGFYRLFIKNHKQDRFANFQVRPNENYVIYVPKDRVGVPNICMDEDIYVKILQDGESLRDYEERYRKEPFHDLLTDILPLDEPFEMVIQYCQKYQEKNVVRYKGARFYYKNLYVVANEVLVDRKLRKVEVVTSYVEEGGKKQEAMADKYEFSY